MKIPRISIKLILGIQINILLFQVDEPTSDKQSIESPETILVVGTKAISINDSLSDDSLKKNANSSIEDTYTVNKEIGSQAVGNLKIKEPVVIAKPKLRAKVPFEIGYSPMDWMKLNRTHPDLAVFFFLSLFYVILN